MSKEKIDLLAENILIELTDNENQAIINKLKEIDNQIKVIDDIDPLTHPFDLFETNLREDVSEEGENINDILKNADKTEGREIEVPKVVG